MIRFSEYVSLGHPDKVADYISQYLLDRYIERDPDTRYAVEVQIKGWHVSLGGEVTSKHKMTVDEIRSHVRAAVNNIGYTRAYMDKSTQSAATCSTSTCTSASSPRTSRRAFRQDGATKASSSDTMHTAAILTVSHRNTRSPRSCAMTCSTAASEGWTSKRRSSWTTTGLSRSS